MAQATRGARYNARTVAAACRQFLYPTSLAHLTPSGCGRVGAYKSSPVGCHPTPTASASQQPTGVARRCASSRRQRNPLGDIRIRSNANVASTFAAFLVIRAWNAFAMPRGRCGAASVAAPDSRCGDCNACRASARRPADRCTFNHWPIRTTDSQAHPGRRHHPFCVRIFNRSATLISCAGLMSSPSASSTNSACGRGPFFNSVRSNLVARAVKPLPVCISGSRLRLDGSTLPLFATGLGTLGLLGWRRKRKVQAAAA